MSKWEHRLSNIDKINKTAICSCCGAVRIKTRGNRSSRCMVAHRKKSNKGVGYGFKSGACAICKKEGVLVMDHNHNTGEIRDWICRSCNSILGRIEVTYIKHIEYLEKHKPPS